MKKKRSEDLEWTCIINNCGKVAEYSYRGIPHCTYHWEIHIGLKDDESKPDCECRKNRTV